MAFWVAVSLALVFSLTNGFHDAANAIATLVATRGARPGQAVLLSAIFNLLGALLVGTAVASTIAGIVTVSQAQAVAVIGSGTLAAVLWNLLTWWRGLPSSSGHALVGGLVGAALAEGGLDAISVGRPGRLEAGRCVRRPYRACSLAADRVRARLRRRPLWLGGRSAGRPGSCEARSGSASGVCPRRSRSATAPTTRRRRWG